MVDTYGPEYVPGPIPASTYDVPGIETVSVKNYVVADPRMSDDLAYAVTRVMFEAQDQIDALAPGVRQPSLGAAIFTSPLDLHPGALRYYRESQP
jgi:TRAP transporter TAXI family solute receptor